MKMSLISERNREIERIERLINQEFTKRGEKLSKAEAIRRLCEHRVSRFYITPEIAQRRVSEILRTGQSSAKTEMRRRMYWDLHDRVVELLKRNRLMTFSDAICEAIEEEAPCIYITPQSMKIILPNVKHTQPRGLKSGVSLQRQTG